MSLSDADRNKLRSVVDKLRDALMGDLRDVVQSELGIDPDGGVKPAAGLPQDPRALETRRLLLRLLNLPDTGCAGNADRKERLDAHLRGIAFTHLHRFVALKMMEAPERRVYAKQVVGPDREKGQILLWLATQDDALVARWDNGTPAERDAIYLQFLHAVCESRHAELGPLFDPHDLASRIAPRQWKALLDTLNTEIPASFWDEDETLGWVYQYYTPKALRDDARKKSSAPRNAWEMAFRNQFYTPDYVVKFLVDNTLGRLWLEMVPDAEVRARCTSLLVAPDETLPARAPKDPREIKVLDPACGSGHFLLYAFEVLRGIYADAWERPERFPALRRDFADDHARFKREVPKLIVEHNLHGVDIDRRAVQLASLALWLKSRKELPADARKNPPAITRSGIVLAEPLPGDLADYVEFRRELATTRPITGRLLDEVREMLKLAGELGSLLRVDEDLGAIVTRQRVEDEKLRRGMGVQQNLFDGPSQAEQLWLDLQDARADARFWEKQEDVLRAALRDYGARAEGFEGAAHHLFARDGANVLRFLDVLRDRYDVVLMNPPFGAATPSGKGYLKTRYPNSCQDLATAFVERMMAMTPDGFVGTLSTDAGFFRRTLESWRREIVLAKGTLETLVHLGGHVLDATVNVAAYVIRSSSEAGRPLRAIRVLRKKDRVPRLHAATDAVRNNQNSGDVTTSNDRDFMKLPYAVFGYWCSQRVRSAFDRPMIDPTLGRDRGSAKVDDGVRVRRGGSTCDDSRWLRLRWELPSIESRDRRWVTFAKGGDYSPFHEQPQLVVDWDQSVPSYRGFVGRPGRTSIIPESVYWYQRAGLTYALRTVSRFAPRTMPAGGIFGHKGPAIFELSTEHPHAPHLHGTGQLTSSHNRQRLFSLLGFSNARPFQYLLSLGTGAAEAEGGAGANAYEVGLLQRMPLPSTVLDDEILAEAAFHAWEARASQDLWDETTAAFALPFPAPAGRTLAELVHARIADANQRAAAYAQAVATIEQRALAHYGFDAAVAEEVARNVGPLHALEIPEQAKLTRALAVDLLSWSVGVALGRFDVRLATGERPWPTLPEPFAPIAARSPGMVPEGWSPDATLVDEDGILVDDPTHPDDVVRRIHAVLARVWGEHADTLVRELVAALKLDPKEGLRGWFTRIGPGGFWEEHRRRYSKSKREAPLYLPLRSANGRFLLWVSYHRLTEQTLYAVVGERYLAGWRHRLAGAISALEAKGNARTAADGAALATARDDLGELDAFERDLRAAMHRTEDPSAPMVPFAPQFDDGLLVCAAPLHAVIPWPPKKKGAKSRLEEVWKLLAGGTLDWAHTAMRYWPTRVTAKCTKDLSLAIAHGRDGAGTPWDGWRTRIRAGEDPGDAGSEPDDDDTDEDEDES